MERHVPTAEQQLKTFIDKFDPKNRAVIRAARRTMRKRFPTSVEMVYDNYNFFVIGYSPTERPSDAIFSIAAAANGVGLCFIHGARLSDPDGLLTGNGKQVRFIRLPTAQTLDKPGVKTLMKTAVARSKVPFAKRGKRQLVIRAISAKQRPRRRD
jgi:hypothetical protein